MRSVGLAALLASAALVTACGQDDKPAPVAMPPAAGGDATRGRQIWLAQCAACHNSDPGKDGPLGPAVKGASKDLLEARVIHAKYPPGYTPKRESKVMPARPDLVASIPDLAAYLR